MDPFARTDIVIIGGGFGGMNAAMALDLRLGRGLKFEIILISRSNFLALQESVGVRGRVGWAIAA